MYCLHLLTLFLWFCNAYCGVINRTVNIGIDSQGNIYSKNLEKATKFLRDFDEESDVLMEKNGVASWRYDTNITNANLQNMVEVGMEVSEFYLNESELASNINTLDLPTLINRQIALIRRSADPRNDNMRMEIKELIGKMTGIYSTAKVYDSSSKKNLTFSDLSDIMKKSRNQKRLNWAWGKFRDKVGPDTREYYSSLVDLLQVGAREHGWIDYGAFVRSDYEMGDYFLVMLNKVWKEIEPLYKELHAYVRYKLRKKYKNISKNDMIPASLLGDMFAQDWSSIFNLVKPFKKCKSFDVTNELKRQNYTVIGMVKLAEKFFTSIGLSPMPASFWSKSIFEKKPNTEMVCHASAWDVTKTDVRIKMCAKVDQSDLTTIHHEMGHIDYFLAYQHQPSTFRAGANPGFHEAIGDTISLSVETPKYLKTVGLMQSDKMSKEDTISFLMHQALHRVAPTPYNFLVDMWRWRVYEGEITENQYNYEWWKLRAKYQGVKPPIMRPSSAFDPASKYHITANVAYIPYFFSYVLQFQLHEALCSVAKHNGPLHECSIYKSREAGAKLRSMLEAGRSEPWPKILKRVTKSDDLNAGSLLKYFQPLRNWLKEQRESKKYPLGWQPDNLSQVLQKKTRRYEPGQERSGILKTNSGDVSLSINIPSLNLNDLISKKTDATKEDGDLMKESAMNNSTEQTGNDTVRTIQPLDLAKLIASGSPLEIKSSETTATNKEGATEINQKEININSMGENIKQNKKEEQASADKQSQLSGISNSTLALIQQLLAGKTNKTVLKSMKNETASKGKSPTVSVPIAANLKPENEFPSAAVSEQEAKVNPQSAGLKNEQSNPKAAAIAPEPKPNPVPPGQIALLPVALPSSLINALKNAMNGTNKTSINGKHGESEIDSFQALLNATQSEKKVENPASHENQNEQQKPTYADNPSHEVSAEQNTDTTTTPAPAQETTQKTTPSPAHESTTPSSFTHQPWQDTTTSTAAPETTAAGTEAANNTAAASYYPQYPAQQAQQAQAGQPAQQGQAAQPVNNYNTYNYQPYGNYTDPIQSMMEGMSFDDMPFMSSTFVEGCKRGNIPCLKGKVVKQGNTLQNKASARDKPIVDEASQTVSVSPSLLIQKLIEHHVADKSTPDPVVNIVPKELMKNKTSSTENNAVEKPASNPTVDIGNLIKALTGAATKSIQTNENSTLTSGKKHILETVNKTSSAVNKTKEIPQSDEERAAILNNIKNCSDLMKRGVSLSFNCNGKPRSDHKGGSLSISPAELVQRLMDTTKSKSDVDKKSVPSARVVKTPNGFQLNFDLNTKDNIPANMNNNQQNPIGRQQHVDVFNTPKGMVVKPKSSQQLLTPQFVPVQNKEHLELGKQEG